MVRHQLRAARGGQVAGAEVEQHRRHAIHLEDGIPVDESQETIGLPVEDEPADVDQIAADVHQPAATECRDVADVGRGVVEVAEVAQDRPQLADRSVARQFAGLQPLRVRADHECFLDLDARPVAHVD